MNRIKKFIVNNKFIFLSFLAPVVLVTIAFAITGIYPFGTQQIAVIDMYHQYLPFLSELQERLQRGGSLFYSWDGAAGHNFWNLISYYGASPLNLLLILFPHKLVGEAVTAILLLRIGLAGAFMAICLRSYSKKNELALVAFSTCYALCSYVMGYYWCIMWMDAVMMLPLIMLGLRHMIKGKGCVLYTVSLAEVVLSNYYIAIEVCIFIAFFYLVMYFTEVKWHGFKTCAITTVKVVFFSLLGVVMAAVMLYPTYLSMQYTYYISSDFPETWSFYYNSMDIINQLLPNAQLTYREGLPNIYSGMLIVMLGIFYVLDKTIGIKEKAWNIGFLTFIFFSFNINVLNFIWHGFHFPNQLPYRYTFVVSFVIIIMAYKAYQNIEQVKVNAVWGALAGILAWMLIAQKLLMDKMNNCDLYVYMGAALLVAYATVMVLFRKRIINKKGFALLLALVVFAEMGINVTNSFKQVGNTSRDVYYENYDDVTALVDQVDDEMVRVEMDQNFILNNPALYHYKGVSQFSSSLNAQTTGLMESIGVEGEPGKNRYNYNQTSPVNNAILGIKYLISKNRPVNDPDFAEISNSGSSYLYKNKYPLSLGYMTGDEIWTWDTFSDNPFEVLDDYVRAATGNKVDHVFQTMDAMSVDSDNIEMIDDGYGAWTEEIINSGQESTVEITYESDKTQKYYVFVEANNCEEIFVGRNNVEDEVQLRDDCGAVVNAGVIPEGEVFTIRITYEAGKSGTVTSHIATLDQAAWDEAYSIISASQLEITDWGDNYLKGEVTAKKDGVLVTSIPYDQGWSLKVDGKKQRLDHTVGDAFIAIPLSQGKHQIALKFRPPGLVTGACVTLASILVLIVCAMAGKLLRRRKKRKAQAEAALVADEDNKKEEDIMPSSKLPQETEEPEESQPVESDYNTEYIDSYPEEEAEGCPY